MQHTALSFDGERTPIPQFAVVFHGVDPSTIIAGTRHRVTDGAIGMGEYISLDALAELVTESVVRQDAPQTQIGFIPETLLFNSAARLVWWQPEAKRTFHFAASGAGFHGSLTHPPLLFVANKEIRSIKIFALDSNARPTPESALYHAPFFNINGGADLCLGGGSALLPQHFTPDTTEQIASAFFEANGSHVNHTNTLGGRESTSTVDLFEFLTAKAKSESKITPDELNPFGKTIAEVLK